MKSGTGILPVGFCGIGILPMIHGLEAHATLNRDLPAQRRDILFSDFSRRRSATIPPLE